MLCVPPIPYVFSHILTCVCVRGCASPFRARSWSMPYGIWRKQTVLAGGGGGGGNQARRSATQCCKSSFLPTRTLADARRPTNHHRPCHQGDPLPLQAQDPHAHAPSQQSCPSFLAQAGTTSPEHAQTKRSLRVSMQMHTFCFTLPWEYT